MKKMMLLACILGSGSLWAMEEEEVRKPSPSERAEIEQPVNFRPFPGLRRAGLAPSESAELSLNFTHPTGPDIVVIAVVTGVTLEAQKEGLNKLTRKVAINIFQNGEFIETRELMPKGEIVIAFGSGANGVEIYSGADITKKPLKAFHVNRDVILVKETIFGKIKI